MEQFLEVFFHHDLEKARLEVDGSQPHFVTVVATPDALAHLAGLAVEGASQLLGSVSGVDP